MLEENLYKWYNRSKSDHNSSMQSEGAEWLCNAMKWGCRTGFPAAAGRKVPSVHLHCHGWNHKVGKVPSAPEDSHAQALSRLGKSSAGRGVVPGRETPLSGANPKPWFYEQREYALCCPTMYVRGRETSSHTSSVLQSYHRTQLTARLKRQEATEQPKACKIWTPKNMIMSKKCLYPMI